MVLTAGKDSNGGGGGGGGESLLVSQSLLVRVWGELAGVIWGLTRFLRGLFANFTFDGIGILGGGGALRGLGVLGRRKRSVEEEGEEVLVGLLLLWESWERMREWGVVEEECLPARIAAEKGEEGEQCAVEVREKISILQQLVLSAQLKVTIGFLGS